MFKIIKKHHSSENNFLKAYELFTAEPEVLPGFDSCLEQIVIGFFH